MASEAVNYDLTGEIHLEIVSLPDATSETTVLHSGSFVSDLTSEHLAGVHEALHEKARFGGKNGSKVHFAIVNEGVEDGGITIVSPMLTERMQRAEVALGIAELAAAFPDRRFLFYDALGHGQSSDLPLNVAAEIARTGRFGSYVSIVLDGIKSVIKDYDHTDVFGSSLGGVVATEMPAQLGKVGILASYDPALTPRDPLSTTYAFLVREGMQSVKYFMSNRARQKRGALSVLLELTTDTGIDVLTGRIVPQLGEEMGLTRGAYGDILTEALPHIEDGYYLLSPRQSKLNNPLYARTVVSSSLSRAQSVPERAYQGLFNGSHSIGFGSTKAVPVLEAAMIRSRATAI